MLELAPLHKKLKKWRIDIDDPINGVALPKTFHKGVHSGEYLRRLLQLEKRSSTKQELIRNLDDLATQLMNESGKLN